KKCQEKTLR
ncbi:Tail-specific protease precursor, partial [Haemophilus influenzae]